MCVCVRATQRKNKNSNWNENVVDSLCSFFFLLFSSLFMLWLRLLLHHCIPFRSGWHHRIKMVFFFFNQNCFCVYEKRKKNTILLIQQRIQFSMFFYISCAHTCILSVHQPPALAPIASYRCCFPSVTALDSY